MTSMRTVLHLFGIICPFLLQAQGTWLSAHATGTHTSYDPPANTEVDPRTIDPQFGLRFGQDLGEDFRFTIGLFFSEERYDMRTEGLFGVTRMAVRTSYVNVPVIGAFRLSATEHSEWRALVGPLLRAPQRVLGDAGSGEQKMDVDLRTGLSGRLGVRHAQVLIGRWWWSCEAFIETPFVQDHRETSYHYPPANALDLPDRGTSFGLQLGIELGPRSRPLSGS